MHSLHKSILGIAENLEQDAVKLGAHDNSLAMLLSARAQQIRSVITAAESTESYRDLTPSRQEIQQINLMAEQEEKRNPGIAELVGGNSDGDFTPIDPAMPLFAFMLIAGQVYTLKEDGKLHFSQAQTDRMLAARASKDEPAPVVLT